MSGPLRWNSVSPVSIRRLRNTWPTRRSALAFEEIELEHVPINQVVDHYPKSFMDGDVLVVPLVEEEIVEVIVRRQLRVREELRIRRVTKQRQETIEVPLRREQAEVTEVWHETPQPPTSPDPLAATDGEPSAPSGGRPPSTVVSDRTSCS